MTARRRNWRKIWRMSLYLTLPFVVGFSYLSIRVLDRYVSFVVTNDAGNQLTLHQIGIEEVDIIKSRIRHDLLKIFRKQDKLGLKSVRLYVSGANLAKLNSNLPLSGKTYVKGALDNEGSARKIKLRYRGDSNYHWAHEKKSLRVKTKRARLYEGRRKLNFVAPRSGELLNNHFSQVLAGQIGLIAPKTEPVFVYINDKPSGIYVQTEQMDESTLRQNGFMPGDIYAGDAVGYRIVTGIDNRLFEQSALWDKAAINNHYPANSRKPLDRLIAIVNMRPSPERDRQLENLLNIEAFAKFSMLEILSSSNHVDDAHNWRLHYDFWRQKFQPIAWDLVGWYTNMYPRAGRGPHSVDVTTSQLHMVLQQNANFLLARNRAMGEFFDAGATRFLQTVDRDIALVSSQLDFDPAVTGVRFVDGRKPRAMYEVFSPDEVRAEMVSLRARIVKHFEQVKKRHLSETGALKYAAQEHFIDLELTGRIPIGELVLTFDPPLQEIPALFLEYVTDGIVYRRSVTERANITNGTLSLKLNLLAEFHRYHPRQLRFRPTSYRIVSENVDFSQRLRNLDVTFVSGMNKTAEQVENLTRRGLQFLHPVREPLPNTTAIVWSGEQIIRGLQSLERPVIVLPGTSVLFEAGATLVLKGRLQVKGTKAAPVIFRPREPNQKPWGALVLFGQGANNSSIRHCKMSGGSGLKADLFEYTAMLSIHGVDGVEIDNCTFSDNRIVDDMVHTVYSSLKISNSRFEGAPFDAIDIDISTAQLDNLTLVNNGNDALDLMTSTVSILNSEIRASGDKAISVGENSRLLAINNILRENEIGVQVKDASVAYLFNQTIEGNKVPLDAYKKNWRYGQGGTILLSKSKLRNNNKSSSADKKSRIVFFDSYVDHDLNQKWLYVDPTVDHDHATDARSKMLLPNELPYNLPDAEQLAATFAKDLLKRRNAQIRGSRRYDN